MARMKLELFDSSNAREWDKLIENSINGSIFHQWKWLKILEQNFEGRLFPLVFFDSNDGKPFAAIPAFFQKKFGLKMVFSPPPGSGIRLGMVLFNKGYRQHRFEMAYYDFRESFDNFVKKLGSNYTIIITNPGLVDMRPFLWAGYRVVPAYTYKLDLSQGEENIWKNLSSSLRWELRQAEKNGIRIIESSDDAGIEYLYASVKQRYEQQGINIRLKKKYLRDIVKSFGDCVRIFLAVRDSMVIGATLYVFYKDTVTGLIGGARNNIDIPGSARYIDWMVITRAKREGYRWYEDFGANTRHLCEAKSKYSPFIDLYFYVSKGDLLGTCAEKIYRLTRRRII
jgi:hypothetical protein